ncbi:hypothetical protein JCM3765_003480 [Sporobolomyces pararoseus]
MASTLDVHSLPDLPHACYFEELPTEVTKRILGYVDEVPRTKESQKNLLSLCLTSKAIRSHAQPLLLKTVYVSIGAGQNLLQLLVENNTSLASVQEFYFDNPQLKNVVKFLKKFVQNAVNLDEVLINKQIVPVKHFVGSSKYPSSRVKRDYLRSSADLVLSFPGITTLALSHVNLKLDGRVFEFPELLRLSMTACQIKHEGGLNFSLPKLRHLAFFSGTSHLWPPEFTFLHRLAPTRVSFTVSLAKITTLPPSVLNSSTLSILFEAHSGGETPSTLQGVRHLLLRLRGDKQGGGPLPIDPKVTENLNVYTSLISRGTHQVETIILSLYGGGGIVSQATRSVLAPLMAACKARNVEIVFVHQPDSQSFESLVPTIFLNRSEAYYTKVRTGGGAQSSKAG